MNKLILFACSPGGHSIQSEIWARVFIGLEGFKVARIVCNGKVNKENRILIKDFNITNFWLLIPSLVKILYILQKEKPAIVISTGAAPGFVFILASYILGIKSVWIDSIANSKKISLSGRMAKPFTDKFFVQWPNLAQGKAEFIGSLI